MTDNNKENDNNFDENQSENFVQNKKRKLDLNPTYGLKNKIKSILGIFTLNLKILFNSNVVDTTKYKIELLNEYSKINNYNKVIHLYENLFSTYTFDNTNIQLLKNVCSAYNNKKKYSNLLVTVDRIFESISLSKEDISFFKMYKGIACLALKQIDKYRKEIDSIYDIEIDNKEKYVIFITLTVVLIGLEEYNEAFYTITKSIEFIPKEDESLYKYYSLLSVIFFKIKEDKAAKLSLNLRKLMEKENTLSFKQCYYVALGNFKIAYKMQKNEFYNISIKYLKKAVRLSKNDKQLTVCFILLQDCFSSMQKYYQARGYTKLVIKHTNSKTLKAKYTQMLSAFYFKTDEFEKSLKTSMDLLNHLDIFEESFVLASIAINHFQLNKFEEAENNIKRAKLLNSKNKDIQDVINTYYEVIITSKKGKGI